MGYRGKASVLPPFDPPFEVDAQLGARTERCVISDYPFVEVPTLRSWRGTLHLTERTLVEYHTPVDELVARILMHGLPVRIGCHGQPHPGEAILVEAHIADQPWEAAAVTLMVMGTGRPPFETGDNP